MHFVFVKLCLNLLKNESTLWRLPESLGQWRKLHSEAAMLRYRQYWNQLRWRRLLPMEKPLTQFF